MRKERRNPKHPPTISEAFKQVRKLRWLLSLCAILLLCPSAFAVEGTVAGFEDVSPDDSFASAVEWAAKEDILTGISERAFSPNTAVTRGQAVTLLWRASGCPEPSGSQIPFADVTQDWAKDAVCWAAEEGITNGISASRFAPDDTVIRTQMAAFLYRKTGNGVAVHRGAHPHIGLAHRGFQLHPEFLALEDHLKAAACPVKADGILRRVHAAQQTDVFRLNLAFRHEFRLQMIRIMM